MGDFLSALYPWTKAIHIMAVISWMAGLFYLPRLFVHHVEQGPDVAGLGSVFAMMEEKLLKMIMNPAMITTWLFGLALVFTPGIVDWSLAWPWVKAGGVLAMSWFHFWLAGQRRLLLVGGATLSGRRYRLMNEVPTALMVVIVVAVVLRF